MIDILYIFKYAAIFVFSVSPTHTVFAKTSVSPILQLSILHRYFLVLHTISTFNYFHYRVLS